VILLTVAASPTPGMVASAHLLVEAGSMVEMVVLVAKAFRAAGASSHVRLGWTEASRMRREDTA
jgi:hypothetical protein